MFDSAAIASPLLSQHVASDMSKPRRCRAMTLTRLDKRTVLAKRIAELRAIYLGALGGLDNLSPIKRMKVDEAAQLKALAELARGSLLRDGNGSLDDIVRIERKASAAERALGIVEKVARSASPLAEHFSRPPSSEGRG
jgi:hypothetical protein